MLRIHKIIEQAKRVDGSQRAILSYIHYECNPDAAKAWTIKLVREIDELKYLIGE